MSSMAMPAVPEMATADRVSAGNTFCRLRWAITLPAVARRSPAISTPSA